MQLTIDDRDDSRRSNLKTVPNVDWPSVEAAIRRLDGRSHTEVTLAEQPDGAYLMIGGGPSRYFVFHWTADERNLVLTDPQRHEGQERMVVGGQVAVYPSRHTVNLDQAVLVAKTYFATGGPDQGFAWVDE